MKKLITSFSLFFILLFPLMTSAQKNTEPDSLKNISLTGLSFRSIGPAVTGGRVIDIAVNKFNQSEYYVASGHGSLWKTTNSGINQTAYNRISRFFSEDNIFVRGFI